MEDLEVNKLLLLSKSQLSWFVDNILDMIKGSTSRFFERSGRDGLGATKLSKFHSSSAWIMRCIVWPSSGGRYFICIPSRESMQGWCSFAVMLLEFRKNFKDPTKPFISRRKPSNLVLPNQGEDYVDLVKTSKAQ